MSNIEISPEDRERLAKTKFGEWFDEFWDKKFAEAFDAKFQEARASRPAPPQGQPGPPPGAPEAAPQRKRSLLDIALTQTFGI